MAEVETLGEALIRGSLERMGIPYVQRSHSPEEIAEYQREYQCQQEAERQIAVKFYDTLMDSFESKAEELVLELHQPDQYLDCSGCELRGYEPDPIPWPCDTVKVLAKHHHVPVPEGLPDRG